jgi:glycogen debranching enzyme
MSIEDIIQNIIQSHANGIRYREWNAGIDCSMKNVGFDIDLKVDEKTGFIVGGN